MIQSSYKNNQVFPHKKDIKTKSYAKYLKERHHFSTTEFSSTFLTFSVCFDVLLRLAPDVDSGSLFVELESSLSENKTSQKHINYNKGTSQIYCNILNKLYGNKFYRPRVG